MGLANKVRVLLAARNMTLADLAARLEPCTTKQNLSKKLRRDNFSERDLHRIARACNAVYEGRFILEDEDRII